jgi:hypothetical protein
MEKPRASENRCNKECEWCARILRADSWHKLMPARCGRTTRLKKKHFFAWLAGGALLKGNEI